MTDERRQRILEVADALEAQGQVASNNAVYAYVMGHRPHVAAVMKERRAAQQAASGGVGVAEVEEEEELEAQEQGTPAAVVAEDLRQLEASCEAWHVALERLWEVEQDGPLSEAQFGRKQWLQYQIVENLQTQERLRPQLRAARTIEAVQAAQQHHDAAVPQALALAEQTLQATIMAARLWQALGAHFDAQQTPLVGFRDRQGNQAFNWLGGGATDSKNLFLALFPGDHSAVAFEVLKAAPALVKLQALAACPRLQPFPPRAISNYLQPFTEGLTNGSHS